jgi:hypothetical protein
MTDVLSQQSVWLLLLHTTAATCAANGVAAAAFTAAAFTAAAASITAVTCTAVQKINGQQLQLVEHLILWCEQHHH